jgi:hypothetical protein
MYKYVWWHFKSKGENRKECERKFDKIEPTTKSIYDVHNNKMHSDFLNTTYTTLNGIIKPPAPNGNRIGTR